jgi:hypothetical protein
MPPKTEFGPRFVEFVPEQLDEGALYVSIEYATVVHLCCCGCGNQVVTPLSPAFWELTYDGDAVTLFPSVGSWNFPCRSHYWIVRNRVVKAWSWTDAEISYARSLDAHERRSYFRRRWEQEMSDADQRVQSTTDE